MTIGERIALVIAKREIKRTDFAKEINVSPASVTQMCSGVTNPSKQTIALICQKYRVREEWLRTGEGPMEQNIPNQERLENFFADVLASAPDSRSAFIASLDTLPPELWEALVTFARQLADNLKAQENDKKTE